MKSFKALHAIVGEDLGVVEDVCIHVRDGVIESIESGSTCPPGTPKIPLLLPRPANAHMHSSDSIWPEVGFEMGLEELVSPPRGLKHILLASAGERACSEAAARTYYWAVATGTGAIGDFREPAAGGCLPVREIIGKIPGLSGRIRLLGRPGDPYGLEGCHGIGLNSPLDVDPKRLRGLKASLGGPLHAHVAETPVLRRQGDLEVALDMGVDAIVHGVHLSEGDLEILAWEGVTLVLAPRSNLWHGGRPPPVAKAVEKGVAVAVGSDNVAWNSVDVWEEAYVALMVGRMQGLKDSRLPKAILSGLFKAGYESLGFKPPLPLEGSDVCSAMWADIGWYENSVLRSSFNKHMSILKIVRSGKARPLCCWRRGAEMEPCWEGRVLGGRQH